MRGWIILAFLTLRWPVTFKLQRASSALRSKASTAAHASPATVRHVPDKYLTSFRPRGGLQGDLRRDTAVGEEQASRRAIALGKTTSTVLCCSTPPPRSWHTEGWTYHQWLLGVIRCKIKNGSSIRQKGGLFIPLHTI